ncbi:MAG: hypothetical protein OEO71_09645 [Gammaproteobacteria bacterium]|nr:hypothetical protein [Gammaproteobacteria bacterium]
MVREQMDPATSVTIRYSQTPMVFYRDVSGRAAYARNFVHMAPLEVNRSGDYQYYLWIGIWNTMADAQSDQSRDGFESIVIFADGEPLPLEIAGWTVAAIGASKPVYLKPVASAADAYYAVTVDQLRLIAEARDVRLKTTGSRNESYEPWDNQKSAKESLIEFLEGSVY